MKQYNIEYRLTRFEVRQENQRSIIGWYTEEKGKYCSMKQDAKVFTRKELQKLFTKEEIKQLESNTHINTSLTQECKELDEILTWIRSHKQKELFGKNGVWITQTFKDITIKMHRGKRFEVKLLIDGHELYSDWGSDSSVTTLNVICDKVRRLYNYDDPYKHYVEDVNIWDLIIAKLNEDSKRDYNAFKDTL